MRKTLLVASIGLLVSCANAQISPCFLSLNTTTGLVAPNVDRLPEEARGIRTLDLSGRELPVSVKDGYRILYKNESGADFVNLKVELSDATSYATDTVNVLTHMDHSVQATRNAAYEKGLKNFNGFVVHGYSRLSIEEGSTLGTYVFFPGNNMVVHVYFQNIKREGRHFKNVKAYRKLRDRFLEEYTLHLRGCL